MVKNYDDIVKCLNVEKTTQLIDVRPAQEYTKGHPVLGESHIPTSKNFPFSNLFDPITGKIKDRTQITECKLNLICYKNNLFKLFMKKN